MEVVEEDDCIREVARIPTNKPTNGLVVVWISVVAIPFPIIFRDVPISSRLNINI
jgi:hypothetical protein